MDISFFCGFISQVCSTSMGCGRIVCEEKVVVGHIFLGCRQIASCYSVVAWEQDLCKKILYKAICDKGLTHVSISLYFSLQGT